MSDQGEAAKTEQGCYTILHWLEEAERVETWRAAFFLSAVFALGYSRRTYPGVVSQ